MGETTAAVEPRHAASLLVLREGAGGAELLMARRAAGHRFMPGVLVFPGGAVDPDDFTAPVAFPLPPATLARLGRSACPALAAALGVAAARELFEELGLSLGTPPDLSALTYLCRAITPPDRPIRFDARFFVVDARCVHGTASPSRELEDPAWLTVAQALQGELAAATRAVVTLFAQWLPSRGQSSGQPVPVLRDRAWSAE